ncbi:hypothetical protein NDU88_004003 [Pleurodeles waltl]|uniref:Uncharacterized protein n=1 Tax=Pleurodeles waltl TaxID=8319 RepID=A0AAV7W8K2_PLEWA|nr:hypothetical protein NDU88_004003 [Pleurodeles waltl]
MHHICCGESLPLGMPGVGDSVLNHILQKDLKHAMGLLIHDAGIRLTRVVVNGKLGDVLDVVLKYLLVPLGGIPFADTLSSFACPDMLFSHSDQS